VEKSNSLNDMQNDATSIDNLHLNLPIRCQIPFLYALLKLFTLPKIQQFLLIFSYQIS